MTLGEPDASSPPGLPPNCGSPPSQRAALLHTDRLATVTRHRRAPAGQPSAGVRADGSSGLRVRLHGREGSAQGGARLPAFLPGRPIGSETETPRLPQLSSHGARRGVACPPRDTSPLTRRSSGKHDVSQTLSGASGPRPAA